MSQFDLPLPQLREYRPELAEPADLDEFWAGSIADAERHPLSATFTAVDSGLTVIDTYDVTFRGADGDEVRGWLHLPAGRPGPLPGVVQYVGYGGGRGLPHESNLWAAAGYAHLVMDTRGQGSGWSVGDTPDPTSGGPAQPGFLTRGIRSRETYYYRRVFVDAVRAVAALRAHPAVDPARVAVAGGSQGGALALAVGSLVPDVFGVLTDVPFLADFPRAAAITDTEPYRELVRYLKAHRDHVAEAFATLAYFDVAVLGRRATAPALFSVGLMDQTCPPSTVYAAFNHYGGPKSIIEYPYNDHEGGGPFHDREKLRWLRGRL